MRIRPISENGRPWGHSFYCPGCADRHYVPTVPGGAHCWAFNGDTERPTFAPSILVTAKGVDDGVPIEDRCHSFVRDGKIQFLGDCTHALAGRTVDLPDEPAVG